MDNCNYPVNLSIIFLSYAPKILCLRDNFVFSKFCTRGGHPQPPQATPLSVWNSDGFSNYVEILADAHSWTFMMFLWLLPCHWTVPLELVSHNVYIHFYFCNNLTLNDEPFLWTNMFMHQGCHISKDQSFNVIPIHCKCIDTAWMWTMTKVLYKCYITLYYLHCFLQDWAQNILKQSSPNLIDRTGMTE